MGDAPINDKTTGGDEAFFAERRSQSLLASLMRFSVEDCELLVECGMSLLPSCCLNFTLFVFCYFFFVVSCYFVFTASCYFLYDLFLLFLLVVFLIILSHLPLHSRIPCILQLPVLLASSSVSDSSS
jgi:hypothetical protein